MSITHPNEQETREMLCLQDYKYLGYQNGWKDVYFDADGYVTEDRTKAKRVGYLESSYPEYVRCIRLGHNDSTSDPHWECKQHNPRGSNCTYWCEECKIFWKVDMSD
jgi:hypothetical protein